MARRDIWVRSKWVNSYGVPVERKRKRRAYWIKGQTYPQDPARKRYLKDLEKGLDNPRSGITVRTFNRVWTMYMRGE